MTTWVAPPTFTALGGATAAMFNKLRDDLTVIGEPWQTYTPTLTASTTNPTQGSSTYSGRLVTTGKTASIKIMLTLGAGFAAGSGTYRIGLPAGVTPLAVSSGEIMGSGNFFDASSGATYAFNAYLFSTSGISLVNATNGVMGAAVPVVPVSGDRISVLIPNLELA